MQQILQKLTHFITHSMTPIACLHLPQGVRKDDEPARQQLPLGALIVLFLTANHLTTKIRSIWIFRTNALGSSYKKCYQHVEHDQKKNASSPHARSKKITNFRFYGKPT